MAVNPHPKHIHHRHLPPQVEHAATPHECIPCNCTQKDASPQKHIHSTRASTRQLRRPARRCYNLELPSRSSVVAHNKTICSVYSTYIQSIFNSVYLTVYIQQRIFNSFHLYYFRILEIFRFNLETNSLKFSMPSVEIPFYINKVNVTIL